MSDHWLFYPRNIGEHTAFIFYDHGIRETINQVAPPQLLKIGIPFKHPRPDGLSSNEEYRPLCELEDALSSVISAHGGLYVGRVTVNKHRYLRAFVPGVENEWRDRLRAVGQQHGYDLQYALESDPERKGYWQDLFPTEDDWQVVLNISVLENLAKHRDDHSQARQIDHWAYFSSQKAADTYAQWTKEMAYEVKPVSPAKDGKLCVRFRHQGSVELNDISSHTIRLARKAKELGGHYDGWETHACAPRPDSDGE